MLIKFQVVAAVEDQVPGVYHKLRIELVFSVIAHTILYQCRNVAVLFALAVAEGQELDVPRVRRPHIPGGQEAAGYRAPGGYVPISIVEGILVVMCRDQ